MGHIQHTLKFELEWLLRDGFYELFKNVWQSETGGHTPMERWQAKIRRLRLSLRGCATNTSRMYKKEKKLILNRLDDLDKKQK